MFKLYATNEIRSIDAKMISNRANNTTSFVALLSIESENIKPVELIIDQIK